MLQVECRVALDSAFCCSRSDDESHSKALSGLPGRMSSPTRQRFPTFQLEYRVILDSAFRPSRSHVESQTRGFCCSRWNVESLYSACCSRWNVESLSTALSTLPGLMSSHNRQCFPILQVECRITLHSAFYCSRSNVE